MSTNSETYPTWLHIDASHTISEEQMDGIPDFYIERDNKRWYVSWRTSACWSGPYRSRAEAIHSVESNFAEAAS